MSTPFAFDLSRCVVADVETYPERWCVGFHGPNRNGDLTTWVVDGNRGKLARLLERLAALDRILVTYNGDHFDVPVIRAILDGCDPYPVTNVIIKESRPPVDLASWPPLPCDHIDLAARLRRGGRIPSLKEVAANLGRPVLRELPYPPGTILTDEQWDEVKRYNEIDLGHTWALLERFAPELQALASLSEKQGRDLRSTPTPRVVEHVFLDAFAREQHGAGPIRPETPQEVIYRPVAGVVRPRTPAAGEWFDRVANRPLPVEITKAKPKAIVPETRFEIGGLPLKVGVGGLHSDDSAWVYYEDEVQELWLVDVASFYPTLIATKGISPAAYGPCGAATYQEILARRLEIKAQTRATTDPAERHRLEVQSTALKLVLNSTFGKFGDPYSSLFDLGALLTVTLSGQLMLIDLIERLDEAGVEVLSANTDGLFIRTKKDNSSWRDILTEWERDTGMTLEREPLQRLVLQATNNYAYLSHSEKIKRAGASLKGTFSPTKTPNSLVVADAVAEALLKDVPPEQTVRECRDLRRFCRVTTRTKEVKSAVLIDDAAGTEVELPKVSRWYRARGSGRRIIHRFEGGRHTTPNHATGITLALDLSTDGGLPEDLDMAWYASQARRIIQGVGGYRHLDPALFKGHPLATEVYARGLAPVPKQGKQQPAGSDPKALTYLWEWDQYPTVGTGTGPEVGILVLDIDEPIRWRASVDKGNSPLLADRWRDLDGSLVSVHGATTAEEVRTGKGRGKLIFILDANEDLVRLGIAHWKKTRGVEVFYGKGLPSVLGRHPDGEPYRLEGKLSNAPTWLVEWLTPKKKSPCVKVEVGAEEGTPPTEVDPAAFDGLIKDLITLSPALGRGSVAWKRKELVDGQVLWVGKCPFAHASGKSSPGDLAVGFGQDGPYIHCKHASCDRIPEINRRLKEQHTRRRSKADIGPLAPIDLTAIASRMVEDLSAGRIALHVAPTGSGKSYSSAQAAAMRCRQGLRTVIVAPTVRMCMEYLFWLEKLVPEAIAEGMVAKAYGRSISEGAGVDAEEVTEEDAESGKYPIDERTMIVIATHAQLGRRGFSRYLRGIWKKLASNEEEGVEAFAVIIDEVSDFIRQARQDFPLQHRVRHCSDPDLSGGSIIPLLNCPKSNRSGNCANCRLVDHGGSTYFNRFKIRELGFPREIKTTADGEHLTRSHDPLQVDLQQVGLGEEIRVGDTTFAAPVNSWYGTPLDEATRRTAPLSLFRRDRETKRAPSETQREIMASFLQFAHNPVLSREYPVDADGNKLTGEILASMIEAEPKDWDEGITFPWETCGVARLRLTDMMPLEQLRRYATKERVGVLFVGATLVADDQEILRAVWPGLVERDHPYSDRRVKQVAIVAPEGHHGLGSLVEGAGGTQWLVTGPLEAFGKGVVFCPTRRSAEFLYDQVARDHPTARLAVENDEEMRTKKTLHTEGELRTYITYSRGVLGLGANLRDLRFLVADAHAFRAISSFTPGQISPEEFVRARAEERTGLLLQNLGRALRGEEGKTVVLVVLNADRELREVLEAAPAIVQGSELPPVLASGKDLKVSIDQAARWLAQDGGEWPEPNPALQAPRPTGRKAKKTKEHILAALEEAIQAGRTWTEFRRTHHPQRHLSPEELGELKAIYEADLTKEEVDTKDPDRETP